MTPEQALAVVREHGVMLVSAKGGAPRLTEAIAGEPIKGSWWGHPQGRRIFAILQAVTGSPDVLVCRLIDGKLTLVHRRLWPQLVSLAARWQPAQIARVSEQHTPSGRHASTEIPFPQWVAPALLEQAKAVDQAAALAVFGAWLDKQ
ncbi:MAG: hypothetical protein V4484_10145 [Pseudomonadota bacterium]